MDAGLAARARAYACAHSARALFAPQADSPPRRLGEQTPVVGRSSTAPKLVLGATVRRCADAKAAKEGAGSVGGGAPRAPLSGESAAAADGDGVARVAVAATKTEADAGAEAAAGATGIARPTPLAAL